MPVNKKSPPKADQPVAEKVQKLSSKVKKTSGLTIDVYDTKGKVAEKIELPKGLFGEAVHPTLLAQAVRVYLANKRHGTASTKTRGEVEGSTRKIYRQKGTGRARHGSIRAPIFVHGGVVFGPKPRDFSLKLPKKLKRKALSSALSQKFAEGLIKVVKGLEKIEPKTKKMAGVLHSLGFDTKNKKALLVVPESTTSEVQNVIKAVRNIEGIEYIQASQVNTYAVLDTKSLILMKESIPALEKTFLKGA